MANERGERQPDDELAQFMNGLLEEVRATARILAAMASADPDATRKAVFTELAAAEARSCVTLWREVEARGAIASSGSGALYYLADRRRDPYRQLPIALEAAHATARRLRDALPRLRNPRLEARLWRVLETEERTIENLHKLPQ